VRSRLEHSQHDSLSSAQCPLQRRFPRHYDRIRYRYFPGAFDAQYCALQGSPQTTDTGVPTVREENTVNKNHPSDFAMAEDNAKRRQIVDGARRTFLRQGFDAASMNDIARAAGVSKGTLYVYFQNKEQLFQAVCGEECGARAESLFKLNPDDPDVEGTLTRVGVDFVSFVCRPEKAPSARSVIAIAERMPEIGNPPEGLPYCRIISRAKWNGMSSRSRTARLRLPNSLRLSGQHCSSR
jgi:hypothetical protein